MKRYIRSDIYTYTGYATDNFGNSLGKYTLTTEAVSAKRAKTNFQHQIRKRLNRVEHFVVNIDENCIRKSTAIQPAPAGPLEFVNKEEKRRCPECGSRLTDGGYCPKCEDDEYYEEA